MTDNPPPEDREPLGYLRTGVAVLGVLVALICAGITLYVLNTAPSVGRSMVLVFGGIPTGFGVLIWWIAVKHGKPM